MEAKTQRNIIIAAIAATAAAVIILVVAGFAAGNREYQPSGWVLKSYEGNVALYSDGKIETVYNEIVLDNLPPEDVKILDNGIAFPTREEAQRAIEDYE